MDASQLQVGLYLAYVGIMLCTGLFGLVRLSTKRFSLQWLVQLSLIQAHSTNSLKSLCKFC